MQAPIESAIPGQRRAWRLRVDHEDEAFVQFDLVGSSRWRLKLTEISPVGLAFRLQDGSPILAVGTQLNGVQLHVVGLRIVGTILVAHVTREPGADTICGAEFLPATEADERTMALLVSCLEKRDPRSN